MESFRKHPFELQYIGENRVGTPVVCIIGWVPLSISPPAQGIMARTPTVITLTSSQPVNPECYMTLRVRFTLKSGGYLKGEGVVLNHTTALVVFPEPGEYKLVIMGYGWSRRGFPVFLGAHAITLNAGAASEIDSRPFVTRPRCKAEDFDSSSYGYWTDLPGHATGTPRVSSRVDERQTFTLFHCQLHYYGKEEAFGLFANRTLMFLGDSTQEELIEAMLSIMGLPEDEIRANGYTTVNYTDPEKQIFVYNRYGHRLMDIHFPHLNTSIHHRFAGNTVLAESLLGAPTFWSAEMAAYIASRPRPDLLVFNSGLHDRIRKDGGLPEQQQRMTRLMDHIQQTFVDRGIPVVWQTTNPITSPSPGKPTRTYLLHHLFDWTALRRLREHRMPVMNLSGTSLTKESEMHRYSDGMHIGYGAWRKKKTTMPLTVLDANAQILFQTIVDLSSQKRLN